MNAASLPELDPHALLHAFVAPFGRAKANVP